MIKKINTVTIKIMGRIKVIVKYLMFTFVMLGFFSSIVQTATYVKFRFKSNYNITSGEASRSGKSGEVFFTTLGAGRSGTANEKFSEDNWSEVGSQSDNSVEEMEEGSYLGFNNCLNPTNWDHDRCNRKGIGEEDDSWPSELEAFKDDITDLDENGYVQLYTNSPSINHGDFAVYLGSNGNPEHGVGYDVTDNGSAHSKFKYILDRNYRASLGLFMMVVPYPGFKIRSVSISDFNDSDPDQFDFKFSNETSDTEGCNSGQCIIRMNRNWLDTSNSNSGDPTGVIGNIDFDGIPNTYAIDLEDNPNSNDQRLLAFYNITPTSNWKWQECVGCSTVGETGSGQISNLWDRVLTSFSDTDIISEITSDTANPEPTSDMRTTTKRLEPDYTFNSSWNRNEQPFVLGIVSGYVGGDLWNATGDDGSNHYLDVYEYLSEKFQVVVQFDQLGYEITTETHSHTAGWAPTSGIISSTPQGVDPESKNLVWGEEENVIITSSEACIDNYIETKTPLDSGLISEIQTSSSVTENVRMYLDEETSFTITVKEDYHYDLNVFEPKFSVENLNESEAQGHIVEIKGYLGINGLTSVGLNDFDISDHAYSVYSSQITASQGINNGNACGYINDYQQVFVDPADFFYIEYVTPNLSTVATVYTFDDDHSQYKTNDQHSIAYSIEPETILAQIHTTENAIIKASFVKYPELKIESLIGSSLWSPVRVSANVHSSLHHREDNDIVSEFTIQPNLDYDDVSSPGIPAVTVDLHKKLLRLTLVNDDAEPANPTIAVFETADLPASGESTTQFHDPAATDIDESVPLTLSFDGDLYYFSLEEIIENLTLYVDFAPFIFQFNTSPNASEIIASDSEYSDLDTLTSDIEIYKYNNILKTSLVAENITAVGNYIATININLSKTHSRTKYYIENVYEETFDDDGNKVSATADESQLSRIYSTLVTNSFSYLQYYSNPAVYDTDIYIGISEFKNVTLSFGGAAQDHGKVIHDKTTLAIENSSEDEYRTSDESVSFVLEPNIVYLSDGSTASVGFRQYDEGTFHIVPDSGYEIDEVQVCIDSTCSTYDKDGLDSYPATSARTLDVSYVTEDMEIIVYFVLKASNDSWLPGL